MDKIKEQLDYILKWMTQADLARAIDVSPVTIQNWIKESNEPYLSHQNKLNAIYLSEKAKRGE